MMPAMNRHAITSLALFLLLNLATGPARAEDPPEPTREQVIALARQTLVELGAAIGSGEYEAFFEKRLAGVLRAQLGLDGFGGLFESLPPEVVDLTTARREDPVLYDVTGLHSGTLIVAGMWPTAPHRLRFELHYLWEESSWRLRGFRLLPRAAAAPPVASQLARTRTALADLAAALEGGDFGPMFATLSPQLQEVLEDAEGLAQAMQSTASERGLIEASSGVDPVWLAPPDLDDEGVATALGYFPTRPRAVFFRFRWVEVGPDAGDWKLLGINVNFAEVGPTPTAEEGRRMARDAIVALIETLRSDDASVFGDLSAPSLAEIATLEVLASNFAPFEDLDPEAIEEATAALTDGPRLTGEGKLALTGRLPLAPRAILFNLAYTWQGGAEGGWKLLSFQARLE